MTTKLKSSLAFNIVIGILFIYSIFLILELPQPYGKISLGISTIGLTLNFLKWNKLRISLFMLSIVSSSFVLYMGTQFALDNIQKRKKFDLDTEVYFEKGSFEIALRKAQELNKPIFIDFYTAWCSPCLEFSREVLTNEKVGDAMNKAFVNLKYDAEKGEGIALAKKYNVSSYPTLIIVNPQGEKIENVGGNLVPNEQT